jgi:putative transposase
MPCFLHWAGPLVRARPLYFNSQPNLTSLALEGYLVTHRYLISQDSPALYITLVTNNRLPVFQKDPMKEVLCRAIDEARKHFLLFAYVVMLDHLHLLTSRPSTTSDVLRILKGLTARRVLDYLKENNYLSSLAKLQHQERDRNYKYSLWQREKNVLPIFSESLFMEKLNYIHLNPVRAGVVDRAVDYRWSSARIWQGCPAEDEPLQVDKDLIYWRRRPN